MTIDIESYFVPDLRTEIQELPSTATQSEIVDRVNLLSTLMNRILADLIGDDGTEPQQRTTP